MRERNLLYLFLGLNVALAGAFMIYLFLSTNRQPGVVATSFLHRQKPIPSLVLSQIRARCKNECRRRLHQPRSRRDCD